MIRLQNRIPVNLPVAAVYNRLGRHRQLATMTDRQRDKLELLMYEAFGLCQLRGVWRIMPLAGRDEEQVELADGTVWRSRRLVQLLSHSTAAALFAATAGSAVVEAAGKAGTNYDGVRALVFDAVGGESADEAMNWLQAYIGQELSRSGCRLTRRRFSPGYGDLPLACQRDLGRLLELERIGVAVNEYFIMSPEKSVTAIAGVENLSVQDCGA